MLVGLGLAKVLGGKEFLRANDLGSGLSGVFRGIQRIIQIMGRIGVARVLQQAERDYFRGFFHDVRTGGDVLRVGCQVKLVLKKQGYLRISFGEKPSFSLADWGETSVYCGQSQGDKS